MKKIYLVCLWYCMLAACNAPKEEKKVAAQPKDTLKTQIKEAKPTFPEVYPKFSTPEIEVAFFSTDKIYTPDNLPASERIFRKICDTIQYKHFPVLERAVAIEKYSLKKDKNFVTQRPDGLDFKLKNGSIFTLKNNESFGESSKSYCYREYLQEIGYYLCFGTYWEGANYLLISDTSGEIFIVNGLPRISPNKKYILTTPCDVGTYYNPRDLCLYEISNTKLKQILTIHDIAVWNSAWEDDENIIFEVLPTNQNNLAYFSSGLDALDNLVDNPQYTQIWRMNIEKK